MSEKKFTSSYLSTIQSWLTKEKEKTAALTAQVAALTEQRDAARKACSKARDWMFDEATIHPDAPAMQLIIDELAAAIAQGEAKE